MMSVGLGVGVDVLETPWWASVSSFGVNVKLLRHRDGPNQMFTVGEL